jgi:photosystem II stability/assembly factor-like uncharacterized protein
MIMERTRIALLVVILGGCSSPSAGNGSADGAPPPRDPCVASGACPVGVWTNVTPAGMAAEDLRPSKNAFGPGSIAGDPARPSDLYVGGSKSGLWKSSDYGTTWIRLSTGIPDVPRGTVIAVAGTTPATIWAAGYNTVYRSVDGGATFTMTALEVSLYSLAVDPHDPTHLISGLHEADGIVESTDGGGHWRRVGGAGFPPGGVSWYPFFIEQSDAAATRKSWFAIAQNGASAVITADGGGSWRVPAGLQGLQHPHGNAGIFQIGATLFVAGVAGPGQGVYRSTDRGASWSRVDGGASPQAVVWGTARNVYAMYAWACSSCNLGTQFETAPQPGTTWSKGAVPPELVIGPNSLAVTSDGSHAIFVGVMWDQGLWRYVEP